MRICIKQASSLPADAGFAAQRLSAVSFCVLLLCSCLFVGACRFGDEPAPKSDLAMAEEAVKARDMGDAEMFFERYLRKNPNGEHRWSVWFRLIDISLYIRQDRESTKNYLEIMLLEYADDPARRREIQKRLADICEELRLYERSVVLWETLVKDEDTPAEDKALFYRKLSHAYMRRLEFTMAADVLDLCMQLVVPASTKADCLYNLGEVEMFTGNLADSEKALRSLLDIPEATPQRRVLAVFMLADVLEQQSRPEEAARLFESIRESYPNSKVIELRLSSLRGKPDPRKPDVVPVKRR